MVKVPKYCSECGTELTETSSWTRKEFDIFTGEIKEEKVVVLKCPHFVSGYSDRRYSHHDAYAIMGSVFRKLTGLDAVTE